VIGGKKVEEPLFQESFVQFAERFRYDIWTRMRGPPWGKYGKTSAMQIEAIRRTEFWGKWNRVVDKEVPVGVWF
jgi:hypothetical protein